MWRRVEPHFAFDMVMLDGMLKETPEMFANHADLFVNGHQQGPVYMCPIDDILLNIQAV
jgi:hypothetical protein